MGPDEVALGAETLVARDAGARGGGVVQLRRGDLRKVPAVGHGGIGIGEEPAVHRARRSRRVPIGADAEEEEEQYQ